MLQLCGRERADCLAIGDTPSLPPDPTKLHLSDLLSANNAQILSSRIIILRAERPGSEQSNKLMRRLVHQFQLFSSAAIRHLNHYVTLRVEDTFCCTRLSTQCGSALSCTSSLGIMTIGETPRRLYDSDFGDNSQPSFPTFITASVRLVTLSALRTTVMWVFTVRTAILSVLGMILLLFPFIRSASTSIWRSVNPRPLGESRVASLFVSRGDVVSSRISEGM